MGCIENTNATQELLLTAEETQAFFEPYIPTPTPDPPEITYSTSLLYSLLSTVFGLLEFRDGQLEAINHVLQQKDCFLRMATGSGKSLVWQVCDIDLQTIGINLREHDQLPSIIHFGRVKRLTVVIFPIKAIINDQMSKLCRLWPKIEAVRSVNTVSAWTQVAKRCIISYHGSQPQGLNRATLELLNEASELPDCLLILPDALQPNHPVWERLKFLHKRGCIARFVLDEADKILDVCVQF